MNKTDKSRVVEAVVNDVIPKQVEPLVEKMKELVQSLADEMYTPKVKAWMKQAPKNTFTQYNSFSIHLENYGNVNHKYLGGNRYYRFSIDNSVEVLPNDKSHIEISKKSKHYKTMRNLIKELDAVEETERRTREVVWSALNSCTTTKKFIESYPDLVPYIPDHIKQPSKSLAVTNAQICKVLNKKDCEGTK